MSIFDQARLLCTVITEQLNLKENQIRESNSEDGESVSFSIYGEEANIDDFDTSNDPEQTTIESWYYGSFSLAELPVEMLEELADNLKSF